MRTFAVGDIHGGLRGLVQLLERLKITNTDQLIFLGDYVDGWSESAQVIQYLIQLSETNDCIFIKGNHDAWCEDWLRTNEGDSIWLAHGGEGAVASYQTFSEEQKKVHLRFFEAMSLYHIDDDKRLFIHAGFTSMHGVEKDYDFRTFYFDRTLWEMTLTMDKRIAKDSKLYPKRLKHYLEIYIGHTPTTNYFKMHPMNAANVWNIDTGAAFSGRLSAIDINTKAIFQSDILKDLYPNELGRNKN
ncbi:metallophosphoesterase family protein [Winogradskyella sp. UBA3174]|uniref:metallophosphoesterase family protein n=1 Tax=Winogradskyella sp. UBA3174 TaxID=1947785 RepID=UPI0025D67774|nr:metallophosphoesterase family protein [Winogradskyella sp. UBA3174]|tara:strand:- start:17373 stop:18104 length:732 start_codon:yes stop_codon:yes gene_type:complete